MRRWLAVGVAAVLACAAMVTAVVARPGPPAAPRAARTAAAMRLVPAPAPIFRYALRPPPPGARQPVFVAYPGGPVLAVYPSRDGADDLFLYRLAGTGQPPGEGRPITLGGRSGRLTRLGSATRPVMQLTWERRDGEWIRLVANGRLATEAHLRTLAGSVVDAAQRITFRVEVGLVPYGWETGGFQSGGSTVTLRDPDHRTRQLIVQWLPEPDAGFGSRVPGVQQRSTVNVRGRPATLIRAAQNWTLQAGLPDGSAFRLRAPRTFTAGEVLTIAGSVRPAVRP